MNMHLKHILIIKDLFEPKYSVKCKSDRLLLSFLKRAPSLLLELQFIILITFNIIILIIFIENFVMNINYDFLIAVLFQIILIYE